MRHAKKTIKLGRKSEHRNLLLANQVCSLIECNRIKTTLAKAKAVRPYAEKMVTLAKRGDLHARRIAFAFLDSMGVSSLAGAPFNKIATPERSATSRPIPFISKSLMVGSDV